LASLPSLAQPLLSCRPSPLQNAHDHRGVAYIAVPLDDGTLPPNWPAGFNRDDLVEGPIGVIDTVLNDYGLPHGAPAGLFVRRNALARHIGAPRA